MFILDHGKAVVRFKFIFFPKNFKDFSSIVALVMMVYGRNTEI